MDLPRMCKEKENMKDGVYLEVFVLSNGKRVNGKIFSLGELVKTLTDKVIDGVFEVIHCKFSAINEQQEDKSDG